MLLFFLILVFLDGFGINLGPFSSFIDKFKFNQAESNLIIVPAYKDEGVRYDIDKSGNYSFKIIEGAYSPYAYEIDGDNKWRTAINVYINQDIQWETKGKYFSPYNEDFRLGAMESEKYNTRDAAELVGKDCYFDTYLNKGDYLIFVTIDEKNSYIFDGKNRGSIIIEIEYSSN
jgi:hypothetical protein